MRDEWRVEEGPELGIKRKQGPGWGLQTAGVGQDRMWRDSTGELGDEASQGW